MRGWLTHNFAKHRKCSQSISGKYLRMCVERAWRKLISLMPISFCTANVRPIVLIADYIYI